MLYAGDADIRLIPISVSETKGIMAGHGILPSGDYLCIFVF